MTGRINERHNVNHIKVQLPAKLCDGLTIELDGLDIAAQVAGIAIGAHAHDSTATVFLELRQPIVEVQGPAQTEVTPAQAEILARLGWTPPPRAGDRPGLDLIRYLVVTSQIVGNPENWSTTYASPIPYLYADRAEANQTGEVELGHDDFCIATLRRGQLLAYGPGMDDFAPQDRDSLHEIARQLALQVHPDAAAAEQPLEQPQRGSA